MEFHFLRIYWFFALIPLGIILFLFKKHLQLSNNWQHIVDPTLLKQLLSGSNISTHRWPLLLLAIIWVISVFALAGPTWTQRQQPIYRNPIAKVILLDLSTSMLSNDIPPDRLTRAKYKILDILNHFAEGQTGMAVFTSESYTVSPLTDDTRTIALMVNELSNNIMPVQGSNISAGLKQSESLLIQGHAKTGTILLITASPVTKIDLITAKQIHQAGFTISVLAMSNPAFTTNITALEQLANQGGGRFSTFTNNDKDINFLLAPTTQNSNIDPSKQFAHSNFWIDQGRWFIFLILPFVLLAFRRGWFMGADR